MALWVICFGPHQGHLVKMPHVSESQFMQEMDEREKLSGKYREQNFIRSRKILKNSLETKALLYDLVHRQDFFFL